VGAANNPVVFTIRFNAPTSQAAGQYQIGRKLLPSGSNEYLDNAGAWQASNTTFRTAVANIEDGETITASTSTGWTDGAAYEWWANFKGGTAGTQQGPDSDHATFISITPITPTLEAETPALDTRPTLRWINSPSTRAQRSFQLAVYTKATYDTAGFDASAAGWQAQAVWFQTAPYVASELFRYTTGADLSPSTIYRPVIRVQDRYGVYSAWTPGNEFTTNFTPPPAPTLTLTPNPLTGLMGIDVGATFNLIAADSSSMESSSQGWINLFNTDLSYDAVNKWLVLTGTGRTFGEADTAHTTYAAWDTAFTDFAAQRIARTSVTTESQITLRKDNTFLIPVTVGQNYSAIFSANPQGYAATGKVLIRWLTAAFAQVSVSTGSTTSLPPNTWTTVPSGSFTAPATTAWAELQLSVTTTYGQVAFVDNVAFARGDSTFWTPGGLGVDLKFIIQRRINAGPWEYVWKATRLNPIPAQSSSLTVAHVDDKACPIGVSGVEYRAQVITSASGRTISSALTTTSAPLLESPAWWLRNYSGTQSDARLRAMSFDYGVGQSNEVMYAQNKEYAIVQESGDATSHDVKVTGWLFDKTEFETLRSLIISKGILYVQRNIGDGFYIRVTGEAKFSQRRAVGATNLTPRHLHTVDFNGEIVGPPEELVA
jgi:hypothetical protein